MKTVLAIFVFALVFKAGMSQDYSEIKDPHPFERLPGFEIYDHSVINFGAYQFCDENGDNLVLDGMISYYYYECDGEIDPQKIVSKFSSKVMDLGGKVYGEDANQKYMFYADSNRLVWIDLFAEDFYYTLNIVERIEHLSDISSADLLKELDTKGEATLYFNFDRGDCKFKEECKEVLDMIADALKTDPSLSLDILAFTDNVGRSNDNTELSKRRAEALFNKLVELGIEETRLSWEGRGEADPLTDNESLEGRSLNNRVVLRKK